VKKERLGRLLLGGYTGLVMLLLIYLPIVVLVTFSFNNARIPGFPWKGFTFRWYSAIWKNDVLVESLINSILVAIVVTPASLVLGILAANGMAKYRYRLRFLFTGYVVIPFVMPWLLLGISLLLLFNLSHIHLSLFTVILSHVSFDLPLVAILVAARLYHFDWTLEEAARDLGASRWETFKLVTFPLIAPTLIAAAIFAFSWSFDAFVVTHFVIGSEVTFPIWVWSALKYPKNLPVINAVSSLVVIIEIVLVATGEALRQKGGEGEGRMF